MCSRLALGLLLLSGAAWAHGNDPAPLPWHELLSDLVVALVTLGLAGAMARFALLPVLRGEMHSEHKNEILGWGAIALAALLGMAWWITRQAVTEAFSPPDSRQKPHQHSLEHGGQMAMLGDYHAEVVRIISGEYRIWLTDAYGREIGASQYRAWVLPRDPKTNQLFPDQMVELEASLEGDYQLARLSRQVKSVQVQMELPGLKQRVIFNYLFDGTRRRGLMPAWCGPGASLKSSPAP